MSILFKNIVIFSFMFVNTSLQVLASYEKGMFKYPWLIESNRLPTPMQKNEKIELFCKKDFLSIFFNGYRNVNEFIKNPRRYHFNDRNMCHQIKIPGSNDVISAGKNHFIKCNESIKNKSVNKQATFHVVAADNINNENNAFWVSVGSIQAFHWYRKLGYDLLEYDKDVCSNDVAIQIASNMHALEGGLNPTNHVKDYYNKENNNYIGSLAQFAVQGENAIISAPGALLYRHHISPIINGINYKMINLLNGTIFEKYVSNKGKVVFKKGGFLPINLYKRGQLIRDDSIIRKEVMSGLSNTSVTISEQIDVISGFDQIGVGDRSIEKKNLKHHKIPVNQRPQITQINTSAIDLNERSITADWLSSQSIYRNSINIIAQEVLNQMYKGVFKSTVKLNKKVVILTLLGTGSFKNKIEWVLKAIKNNFDLIKNNNLHVYLVYYDHSKTTNDIIDKLKYMIDDVGKGSYTIYTNGERKFTYRKNI